MVLAYAEADALPPGSLVKLYFAAGGYITPGRALWGAPPIAEALDLYLAMLAPGQMYETHVSLITHGRRTCHAQRPDCEHCPLAPRCRYFDAKAE